MEPRSNGVTRTQIETATRLIKKAVQARRRSDGFRHQISPEQWTIGSVRNRLEAASNYLVERCCEAERQDLAQNPYPDDHGLEAALLALERTLNGLMTYSGEIVSTPENATRDKKREPVEEPGILTATQEVHSQAATDYIHWLLDADDWVQNYRANIPKTLTEQEMVDFLMSPLSQVLSFADFQRLGLCPLTTRGRIALIKQWSYPKPHITMADSEMARRYNRSLEVLVSEFAIEVDQPDGTTIPLTIERQGEPVRLNYHSELLWEDWESLSKAGWWREEGGWFHPPLGGLGDKEAYPDFPYFCFTGYPESIVSETYGLVDTMRENSFYDDASAALLFLLMGISAPLFGLKSYQESIFISEWRAELRTKIHLTVPQWVLPEELSDYWRQVRPNRARERRLPSAINTELFRFVLQNTRPGAEPQWATLARQWSQASAEALTRDKLYKVYHSVLDALFPDHPSKEQTVRILPRLEPPEQWNIE